MNGAESLVRTLVASDVEVCFANPGTSEMHFVAALDAAYLRHRGRGPSHVGLGTHLAQFARCGQ